MPLTVFDRPIPGQSLTDEPRNYPWERPPQMSDPEEVLHFYIEKLEDPDMMDNALLVLEDSEMTLTDLVKGLTRSGVSAGRHSIDTGLIVAPAIHEYIKKVADIVGVPYEEGLPKKGTDEAKERKRAAVRARELMKSSGVEMPEASDVDMSVVEDMPEETVEQEVEVEDMMAEEKPAGLMARRSM